MFYRGIWQVNCDKYIIERNDTATK